MTPKVPLSRCKKCPHYRGYCPLEDLDPCVMYKPQKPWQTYLRVVGIPVAILAAIIFAVFLLSGCSVHQEPEPEYHHSAVEMLRKQHGDELSEWNKLIMAIAFTESRFRPDAVGTAQDFGVLQITPIYVYEVNRVSGANFSYEDAFSVDKSLEMFALMQEARNPQKDRDVAIWLHNKSDAYRRTVLENLELIRRYEAVRAKLK